MSRLVIFSKLIQTTPYATIFNQSFFIINNKNENCEAISIPTNSNLYNMKVEIELSFRFDDSFTSVLLKRTKKKKAKKLAYIAKKQKRELTINLNITSSNILLKFSISNSFFFKKIKDNNVYKPLSTKKAKDANNNY